MPPRSFYSTHIHRLRELDHDAEVLEKRSASSNNEAKYLRLVRLFLSESIKFLQKQDEKISSIPSNQITVAIKEKLLNIGKDFVNKGGKYITYTHRVHSIALPMGTEGLLNEIFKSLSSLEISFFLNPSSSEDYSIMPRLCEGIKDHIRNAIGAEIPAEFDSPLVLVNFLDPQKSDTLRHAVLAHEAGHALIRLDPVYRDAYQKFVGELQTDIDQSIAEFVSRNKAIELTVAMEHFIPIYNSWMEEFFVDLIAAHSLGPAGYFAMHELTSEEWKLSANSPTHPPIYKRCSMMFRLIKMRGFLDLFPSGQEAKINADFAYYDNFGALDDIQPDNNLVVLNKVFTQEKIGHLVSFFDSLKLQGAYTAEAFANEAQELATYFERGIAACEIVNAQNQTFIDVLGQSVLNACWLVETSDQKKPETNKLNEILNKALANVYIKQKWKDLSEATE